MHPDPAPPGASRAWRGGAGAESRVVPSGGLRYRHNCAVLPILLLPTHAWGLSVRGPQPPRGGPGLPVTRDRPACRDLLSAACAIKPAVTLLRPTRPPVCCHCGRRGGQPAVSAAPASGSGRSALTLPRRCHHRPTPVPATSPLVPNGKSVPTKLTPRPAIHPPAETHFDHILCFTRSIQNSIISTRHQHKIC